jgi:hypothetical protein
MIKFKAKHLRDNGYSLHLPGNDGECELIIVTSWGQDKKTRLVIVGAMVDDTVTVLHEGKGRMTFPQVLTTIGNVVKKWSHVGIKPTPEEQAWLDRQYDKLMDKLIKKWEIGLELDPRKQEAA